MAQKSTIFTAAGAAKIICKMIKSHCYAKMRRKKRGTPF